jgi:hypothetical protein
MAKDKSSHGLADILGFITNIQQERKERKEREKKEPKPKKRGRPAIYSLAQKNGRKEVSCCIGIFQIPI